MKPSVFGSKKATRQNLPGGFCLKIQSQKTGRQTSYSFLGAGNTKEVHSDLPPFSPPIDVPKTSYHAVDPAR